MNQVERYLYYRRIYRYKEKKTALENLKVDFKTLLGINKENKDDIERRYQCQMAREDLTYLIGILIYEQNPYQAKQEIKKYATVQELFDYYGLNINTVTKEDVDVLFKIMKKI